MIHFFQRLGCCNCCNPSTDVLEAEDRQVYVTNGQERLASKLHSNQSITQVAAMFERAHNFSVENAPITNIGQQVNNNHHHVCNHGINGLDNLKEFVSFSALYDSSAQDPKRCCHPDTRKTVLGQIHGWADDPSMKDGILWMHGPAGVGKSAIAQTIANSYDQDKVGATFFFFRSDPARNDGNRLFPTLAWQLALSVPPVNKLIAFSLEKYPDLPRKAIEVQFNKLIAQPFLDISGGESTAPTSRRLIVIDGLDECSDVELQERILDIIRKAVADTRFPLHFLISSHPEAYIKDFFDKFQFPVLRIDLANVDDGFRDIKTYLTSEFARIAVEQGLDPSTWPAQGVVDILVSKSSAQFVYASTVMKYIGDKYESAVAQLAVILGLKPSTGKSPFAELDALYTEILKRQPDQNFLKEFLPLLVACSLLSNIRLKDGNLHEDDAILLNLDETQLQRKLRGMHSVLKFEPYIDVHHKSFLDFLDDSSRSGEYHISKHFANKRYMQRITDLLVTSASRAMKQLDIHEGGHFQPRFANVIKSCPLKIELLVNDLEEILRPLQIIQENLLQLPNMSIPWKPRACEECWTFYMINDLFLHLTLLGETQLQEAKYVGIRPLTAMEEKESIPQLDLDTCLSQLLASLNGVELLLNVDMIGLMRALVRFDPIETAMKIRSITDAQNLVEFIFYINKNQCYKSWFGAAAQNATRLAVAIYGRVPLLPRSLFLNSIDLDRDKMTYQGKAVVSWGWSDLYGSGKSFGAFMWGSLSHDTMGPLQGICSIQSGMVEVFALPENAIPVRKWRERNNPSVPTIQQIFFGVAKAIQYIHTLGIVFSYKFNEDDVYINSDNHVKLLCPGFCPNDLCKVQFDYEDHSVYSSTLENNIYLFTGLFYRIFFNYWDFVVTFQHRPNEPEIPDNVWQLIQWCGVKDLKELPTIDQVVQEVESWISLGQFTLSSR